MQKVSFLATAVLLSSIVFPTFTLAQTESLTNDDVISLVKAGIESSVVIEKIRTSATRFDLSVDGLLKLKQAGVADEILRAMFNGKDDKTAESGKPKRLKDELGSLFGQLKNSVVTVWSEMGGHGSGFIISEGGLILTNFHVVGPSEIASVQFDEDTKVEAKILAADSERDVAVLWADITNFKGAVPVKFVDLKSSVIVEEGERVIAIGSPLNQRKIMTTGVVSKVEDKVLISDVNINHGNSGGPLFNSLGEVIGINTFGDFSRQGGPGISGIVRIEQALPVIQKAAENAKSLKPPSSRLLLVEPKGEFPISAIKEIASAKKFDYDPYVFNVGKFTVTLITPTLKYRMATEDEREAMKGRNKREANSEIKGTFRPFTEFAGWAEYVGEYKPVLHIRAMPEIGETGSSMFARALVGGLTGIVPRGGNFRFKADFYSMKLYCGDALVEPIQPSKVAHLVNTSGSFVNIKDATYEGIYTYPADAITSSCGTVRIEIFSAQKPNEPQIENVKPKYIQKLAQDFKPYFEFKQNQ
jgi:S1-C subfamily serine protease